MGEPKSCLGRRSGKAFVVHLDVDVASVERAVEKRDLNTVHNMIFYDGRLNAGDS